MLWLSVLWLSLAADACHGQTVEWGLGGAYRVGQWSPVRVQPNQQLQLETIDGDGVRVRYSDPAPVASPWRYVIPGARAAPLVLRDAEGQIILSRRFPDETVAVDRRWALVLGDPLGVDEFGKNELLGRGAQLTTTVVSDPQALPDHWIGYESIDVLLITATAAPMLSQLSEPVMDALTTWVKRGGFVVVSIGASGVEAYENSALIRRLIPFQSKPSVIAMEPAPIEAFTSSQVRLETFDAITLPVQVGEPLLIGRSVERQPMAVAMQYRLGLGQVVAVAADLDREPFVQWPQRKDLITTFATELFPADASQSSARRSGDVKYNDLAGQVRATLDRFESPATMPFSLVAVGLMILFLLIGPVDYLLINSWLKRPLVGWVTFPLLIIAASALLVSWWSRGDSARVATNRLEVVDINAVANTARGFRWDFLYSPRAARFDLQLDIDEAFRPAVAGGQLSGPLTAPFGYSGPTFGGIEVNVEDQRLPFYDAVVRRQGDQIDSRIESAPLAPGSSKGFGSWWSFDFASDATQGLQRRRRAELAGRLVNPLPVDVLDGMILDRDKVYILPSRFRAGAAIERVEELRPRVLRWLLTGRKHTDDMTVSDRWDQANDRDIRRVAEVLTFYDIAGGEAYTGVGNVPLRRLDLSHILTDDRALLIGRLDRPSSVLHVDQQHAAEGSATPIEAVDGQTVSIVRVLLPVEIVRSGN